MSESDTPRTDNFIGHNGSKKFMLWFARELERELNATNKRITELEQELRAAYERT